MYILFIAVTVRDLMRVLVQDEIQYVQNVGTERTMGVTYLFFHPIALNSITI